MDLLDVLRETQDSPEREAIARLEAGGYEVTRSNGRWFAQRGDEQGFMHSSPMALLTLVEDAGALDPASVVRTEPSRVDSRDEVTDDHDRRDTEARGDELPPESGTELNDDVAANAGSDSKESAQPSRRGRAVIASSSGRLVATPLETIQMRSIEWLEKPLWQRSAFQLLAGAKGSGKGTYLAGLAARISQSGSNVLFVSSEDSVEIDLVPRLVAAGAEIPRCKVIEQHVKLPDDVPELRRLAESIGGLGLLVIDPVANHIGARNSNSDAEVRDAIAPLNGLADELGALVIGVRHPGKARDSGALASILGSVAWVDTPRAVVMIAVDDEDPLVRHIQVVAGNRSLNGSAQAFRLEAVPVEGLTEPITLAVPLGESQKSVDDLIAAPAADSKSRAARTLILDILDQEGEQESDELDARVAREIGLAVKTVKNARGALAKAGLVRNVPLRDQQGSVQRWYVRRTEAERPSDSGH